MEGLGAIVVVVAQSFTKVDGALQNIISSYRMSYGLKNTLEKNRKEWNQIYIKFGNLVSRSIDVTSEGLSTANDFVVTLAPTLLDGNVSKDQKKRQISEYIGDLDTRTHRSQDMSQAFVDLEKNASRFVGDFKSVLSGYNVPGMKRRIDQIDNEIRNLRSSISRLESEISHVKSKLTDAKVAIGATGYVGLFMPVAFLGTAAASMKASKYSDQIDDLKSQKRSYENDIPSKERTRDDLQADVRAIPPLSNSLEKCSPDMQGIVQRIAICAKTWAQVRADTHDIKNKLEFVQKTETDKLFRDRVVSTGKMCANLRNSLVSYQQYTERSPDFKQAISPYDKAAGRAPRPIIPASTPPVRYPEFNIPSSPPPPISVNRQSTSSFEPPPSYRSSDDTGSRAYSNCLRSNSVTTPSTLGGSWPRNWGMGISISVPAPDDLEYLNILGADSLPTPQSLYQAEPEGLEYLNILRADRTPNPRTSYRDALHVTGL